jgi:hypothetical protein
VNNSIWWVTYSKHPVLHKSTLKNKGDSKLFGWHFLTTYTQLDLLQKNTRIWELGEAAAGNHCTTMKKVPSIKEDNRKINFASVE